MRDVLLIVRREFHERVASKFFVLGTLLFPLLMIGLMLLPALVGRGGADWHLALVSDASIAEQHPTRYLAIWKRQATGVGNLTPGQ